jgi:hypothetical protein
MSVSLRTTILATGCILAIGTSAARAQVSPVFYYPAPGNYATTQGTVNIPAAGYYYNVPLYAVAAPVNPAPAQGFTYSSFYYPPSSSSLNAAANPPAQGSTYSYFYYPAAPSFGYRADPNFLRVEPMTGSAYGARLLMAPSSRTPPELGVMGGLGAN